MNSSMVKLHAENAWSKEGGGDERAVLANWFVREGGYVRKDQVIAEVGVDKVAVEVTSPVTGILKKIKVQENQEFGKGDDLALIEPTGD